VSTKGKFTDRKRDCC